MHIRKFTKKFQYTNPIVYICLQKHEAFHSCALGLLLSTTNKQQDNALRAIRQEMMPSGHLPIKLNPDKSRLIKQNPPNFSTFPKFYALPHMSFIEANQGASNPTKNRENCQSVVVAFEARRRGLDCYALPYSDSHDSASFALGKRFQDAWINPKTGKVIEPTILKGASDSKLIRFLRGYFLFRAPKNR